jgi:hypothetical protein
MLPLIEQSKTYSKADSLPLLNIYNAWKGNVCMYVCKEEGVQVLERQYKIQTQRKMCENKKTKSVTQLLVEIRRHTHQ